MAYDERGGRSAGKIEDPYAGYTVYDRHYEKIGKVDDLFVDENDRPEYIGVKIGLLGIRSTLIPMEIARVNDRRQLIEVAADRDAVKEGPTFGDDREITPGFERRVLSYYRVESAQASAERNAYGAYYPDDAGEERVDLQPGERAETYERPGEEYQGARAGDVEGRRRGRGYEDELERGRSSGDELRVQRVEEELRAGTREREAGSVNVRKRVRTNRERLAVPKRREEVSVERVPIEAREPSEADLGDDEVRIPVIEEEIVVEKRPVVKEEIRLRKEVVEDEEVVEADLRKEEVDIEDTTGRRGHGTTDADDETTRRGHAGGTERRGR